MKLKLGSPLYALYTTDDTPKTHLQLCMSVHLYGTALTFILYNALHAALVHTLRNARKPEILVWR